MGLEIERKYLVDRRKWMHLDKPPGQHYRQGYILTDPQKTIRVRLTESTGYLTIKGKSVGATRSEYEYQIPRHEAKELLDEFSVAELSKIRYTIPYNNKVWEVDEFLESNAGLIIAEIELENEDEHFDIPDWIGQEVTGENKYYNSRLTTHPFNTWK